MKNKVAVILSGCGFLDGAEIRESVLSLLALDKAGAEVKIFAPDINQHHAIDHSKSEEEGSSRNVLVEASRIARGDISPLSNLKAQDFEALVIPGGFGVAKNLSTLAFEGPKGELNADFERVLNEFYEAKKPIGAICISPAVICLALGKHAIEVTIGNDEGTAGAITELGAKHINKEVHEVHVDTKHRIVSTPAYMFGDAPLADVAMGIEKCVDKVLEMLK